MKGSGRISRCCAHCCHSNLTRALGDHTGLSLAQAEPHIRDVLKVFMCTGFTRDTGQYFMKASPLRPGDCIAFFAEIDLFAVLSACPGGDWSQQHSSDTAVCHPRLMEVWEPRSRALDVWRSPPVNGYDHSHGRLED